MQSKILFILQDKTSPEADEKSSAKESNKAKVYKLTNKNEKLDKSVFENFLYLP